MRVQSHIPEVKARLRESVQNGFRAMGSWLAAALQARVGYQTGPDGPPSPPGTAPFRRTGAGQESIGYQMIEDGVRVGVEFGLAMPYKRGTKQISAGEYMILHDQGDAPGGIKRPWLSDWRIYAPEMASVFMSAAKS